MNGHLSKPKRTWTSGFTQSTRVLSVAVVVAGLMSGSLCSCATEARCDGVGCDGVHVGCESALTAGLSTIPPDDWPSGLSTTLSGYDNIAGNWTAQYRCHYTETPVPVEVEIALAPHEEIQIVLGPPEDLDPDSRFRCSDLALATGSILITGTGEPLVDCIDFSTDVLLRAPEDTEVVIAHGEQLLPQNDEYSSVGVQINYRDDIGLAGIVSLIPQEVPSQGPTVDYACDLFDWVPQ